jgi:hypothetical protein
VEDGLNETWRIQYDEDRSIVEYTFDYHAEGSDAASEWYFCDEVSAPSRVQELALHEEGADKIIGARLVQMVVLTCRADDGEHYTVLVPVP